jgi:hypothetical protein
MTNAPTTLEAAPAGGWFLTWSLVGLGVAAALLTCAVPLFTPCDPNAPIMSFDGSHAMPQPYGKLTFWSNVASPILLGLAFFRVTRGIGGCVGGLAVWLVTGFLLYFVSVQVWKAVCPV